MTAIADSCTAHENPISANPASRSPVQYMSSTGPFHAAPQAPAARSNDRASCGPSDDEYGRGAARGGSAPEAASSGSWSVCLYEEAGGTGGLAGGAIMMTWLAGALLGYEHGGELSGISE
jgi:hypothetical protein